MKTSILVAEVNIPIDIPSEHDAEQLLTSALIKNGEAIDPADVNLRQVLWKTSSFRGVYLTETNNQEGKMSRHSAIFYPRGELGNFPIDVTFERLVGGIWEKANLLVVVNVEPGMIRAFDVFASTKQRRKESLLLNLFRKGIEFFKDRLT